MAIQFKTIEQLPNIQILGSFSTPITGVSIDTRSLNTGDLFVAFIGTQVDGHDFIQKAISRGASAVMASTLWAGCENWESSIPLIMTDDPIGTLADLATAHRKTFDVPVIAITGTNGKTSTKNMLSHILSRRYKVLATQGNYNNHIGLPVTLLHLDDSHDIVVLEMGASKEGDIQYLCEIGQPTQGLITNISHAHTEFFHDLETIQRTKGELFQYLGEHFGRAFVNLDDPRVAELGSRCPNPISFGYSKDQEHQFELTGPDDQACYGMIINGRSIQFRQPGKAIALNGAAAATIALQNGVLYDELQSALESYSGESGRMQIHETRGVRFFNDAYNANPASVRAGIETIQAIPTSGRKIIVFADMLELGAESAALHRQMADAIKNADFNEIILLGDETAATAKQLGSYGLPYFHSHDKTSAEAHLMSLLCQGDLVYLKGSRGMALETFIQAYEDLS
jgi:UDP-N-acetylmuramoyl-tripeptide--D-alanyl-D-alanine ligase